MSEYECVRIHFEKNLGSNWKVSELKNETYLSCFFQKLKLLGSDGEGNVGIEKAKSWKVSKLKSVRA